MRPLTLSLARSSSSAVRPAGGEVGHLCACDLDALRRRSRRACRRRCRPGRRRRSSRRSCRRCRPCRAARASPARAARRRRRRARGRAARARSGDRRRAAGPGADRQTWYCSVSRARKSCCPPATTGVERTARSAGAELQALGDERAERLVLDVARRGDDDVAGAVALAVVGRDVAVGERAHRRGGADHGPAELVVAEHAARRQVVHEIGRDRPRSSRSPRARPRARTRAPRPRSAGARPCRT